VSERSAHTDGLGGRNAPHAGRTITWRELWAQTAERVGSRPMAQWLCATASGFDGDEWREALDQVLAGQLDELTDALMADERQRQLEDDGR